MQSVEKKNTAIIDILSRDCMSQRMPELAKTY